MDTQPTPTDEPIPEQEAFMRSVAELDDQFKRLYHTLGLTVTALTSYAQATHLYSQPQSTSVAGLEKRFKKLWKDLELTFNEVRSCAAVAQYCEQQFDQLVHVVRAEIDLVQTVRSGEDITPQWLVQRDTLVAQIRKLIDDDQQFADSTEEGTNLPLKQIQHGNEQIE